jgi:hypothetical protein
MPDYSLVPVDYQPDFDDYSLVPVDYDPFAADGVAQQAQIQQAQFQQPPTPTPPAQPQPQTQPQQPATGAGLPGVNGPATGNSPSGSGGGAGVGNAGIDPSNPTWAQGTWAQGWSPESAAFDGFANPTPTQPLTDDQVALRRQEIVDRANAQIGSPAWTSEVAKGNFPKGTNKFNLFVHEMLTDAGASPGTPNGLRHPSPPSAGQWADPSYAIPGWHVLGSDESPQPGDVVAQPRDYRNATGHVMIVGPNNTFIGVERPEYEGAPEKIESVPKKDIIVDPPAKGPLLYRRYFGP